MEHERVNEWNGAAHALVLKTCPNVLLAPSPPQTVEEYPALLNTNVHISVHFKKDALTTEDVSCMVQYIVDGVIHVPLLKKNPLAAAVMWGGFCDLPRDLFGCGAVSWVVEVVYQDTAE